MEALDEKIAMLERGQRLEKRKSEQVIIEAVEEEQLSIDDIRAGIQKGHVVFPEDRELTFKTNFLFSEKIPLIYIDDFYTDYQETEEMVIYVNNKRDMGQTLVHLPKEMEKISVESWAEQIKTGMKEQGLYTDIVKKKKLENLDYIIYRTPSKRGWIYNIIFRIHKEKWNIVGAYNCKEDDKDTYGLLMEDMVLEMQMQIK